MEVYEYKVIIFFRLFIVVCAVWRRTEFVSGCVERERDALLSFKAGLVDDGGHLSSWGSEECCSWFGVECSNSTGQVTALQLADRVGLRGRIPPELGNLTNLRTLDLSGNHLWSDNLYWLSRLSSLSQLRLDDSNISDANWVQNTLLQLPSLQELHLSNCGLTDDHLILTKSSVNSSSSASLSYLDLSYNQLASTFHWLFNITKTGLVELKLSNNKLSGAIPDALGDLLRLQNLHLAFNMLEGELPESMVKLTQLRDLNASHNQISGTIPDFSLLVMLSTIDLSFNKFSGTLPPLSTSNSIVQFSQNLLSGSILSICSINFSIMFLLDLSNNKFSGKIPNCWNKLPWLMVLNLRNNTFSSEIPDSIGSLFLLTTLHLGDNNLYGELPTTLKDCNRLQLIDIGDNNLTGNIPSWLGESYPNMTCLSLRRNGFYGVIPQEICILRQLQLLDLSENNVSGSIPECFANFTSLVDKNIITSSTIRVTPTITTGTMITIPTYVPFIDYALVQWKGSEREYRKTLGLLKLIDLSSNKLVGNIPIAFSELRGLISLNLSRNGLTGNIDQRVGEMERLECLDLSGNRLSGEIPTGLPRLNHLAVLDLSNNNLSGEIPTGTQLQSFDASAYAGNNQLCGLPLPMCPTSTTPPNNTGEEEDKNGGFFSLSFMQIFGISMALGFILGFWGALGSLLFKKSWRMAFFKFFDDIGDWLYVTTMMCFNKFKRRCK